MTPVLKQFVSLVSAEFVAIESQEYLSSHLRLCDIYISIKDGTADYLPGGIVHRAAHAQTLLT